MPLTPAEKQRLYRARKSQEDAAELPTRVVTLATLDARIRVLDQRLDLIVGMCQAILETLDKKPTTPTNGTHKELDALLQAGKVTRGMPSLPACIEMPSRFYDGPDGD